jgi:prolyl-tRNA editing enzyme YbaK/EbsC (Cys-tRNA(Pro) deacylase)
MVENDSLLHDKVRAALHEHGLEYKVLQCDDHLADTAAFCEHYGFTPQQSANTILIANRRDPSKVVACVALADSRLDVNKKVSQLMQAKKISFATAEQTVEVSGMEIGGVVIFGLPENISVYVDARVMEQPKIVMGGGNRTSKTIVDPRELVKLPRVEVVEGLALAKQ